MFFAALLLLYLPDQSSNDIIFIICDRSPRVNCIVDGDTFWFDGQKIRIADIDTPEITRPKCLAELQKAKLAKVRLLQILNDRGFQLKPVERDQDHNGRYLRIIEQDGASIGAILIAEGLAHKWQGRKQSWCQNLNRSPTNS